MTPLMSISGLGGANPSFVKGGAEASFSWKYHMYGSNMGSVLVYWKTGNTGSISGGTLNRLTFTADGTSTNILSGQQQSSSSDAWKDASANLGNYIGTTGRIVFLYIKIEGSSNNTSIGFKGDNAVDNMTMTINGVDTSLVEPNNSTSTLWWSTPSYGLTYSSVANCESTYEGGSTFNRVVDVDVNNDGGGWLKNNGGTGSSNTGPSQSARGSSAYYIYNETTANQGLSNYPNKFAFLVSNEFTLS